MVTNDIKTSRKMENKGWLSIEKDIMGCEKYVLQYYEKASKRRFIFFS